MYFQYKAELLQVAFPQLDLYVEGLLSRGQQS